MLQALVALTLLTAHGCIDVSAGDHRELTLEGRLSMRVFPGPPNYEDSRRGDRPERIYMLTLARPICVADGGDFAAPGQRFRRVHIYTSTDTLRPRLRAGLGRRIRVRGSAFAAHTAHHRAPLIVDASEVRVLGR